MAASETTNEDNARNQAALSPAVDVIEDPAGITLYADLPGVPRDKLSLQIESEILTIDGEMSLDMPEGMQAVHAEVSLPRYRRQFTLSRDLDGDQVSAEYAQGVLRLRIPKAKHAQPRRIEVNVA